VIAPDEEGNSVSYRNYDYTSGINTGDAMRDFREHALLVGHPFPSALNGQYEAQAQALRQSLVATSVGAIVTTGGRAWAGYLLAVPYVAHDIGAFFGSALINWY